MKLFHICAGAMAFVLIPSALTFDFVLRGVVNAGKDQAEDRRVLRES